MSEFIDPFYELIEDDDESPLYHPGESLTLGELARLVWDQEQLYRQSKQDDQEIWKIICHAPGFNGLMDYLNIESVQYLTSELLQAMSGRLAGALRKSFDEIDCLTITEAIEILNRRSR